MKINFIPNIHLEVTDKQEGWNKTIFITFLLLKLHTEIYASMSECVEYLYFRAYEWQAANEITYNLGGINFNFLQRIAKICSNCYNLEVCCFSIPVAVLNKIDANHLHAGTARRHTNNNGSTHSCKRNIIKRKKTLQTKLMFTPIFQLAIMPGYIYTVKMNSWVKINISLSPECHMYTVVW